MLLVFIIAGCLISCSVEVRNLPNGKQQAGSVSISVGLLCVNSGFMYLWSNPDQYFANRDLSPAMFSCEAGTGARTAAVAVGDNGGASTEEEEVLYRLAREFGVSGVCSPPLSRAWWWLSSCQFHQHFTSSFWVNIFVPKSYKAKL